MKKTCYCHNCGKWFHYLGINRHRAMHRDRKEVVEITYTHGDTYVFDFRDKPKSIAEMGNAVAAAVDEIAMKKMRGEEEKP